MTAEPNSFSTRADDQIAELFRFHMVGPGEILMLGTIFDAESKMDTPTRNAFRAALNEWTNAGLITAHSNGVSVTLTEAGYNRVHR